MGAARLYPQASGDPSPPSGQPRAHAADLKWAGQVHPLAPGGRDLATCEHTWGLSGIGQALGAGLDLAFGAETEPPWVQLGSPKPGLQQHNPKPAAGGRELGQALGVAGRC